VRLNYFKLENQVLNIEVNYKTITTLNNEKIYSALLFLFLSVASAQAPSGYYGTATGTGYTLKPNYTIKGHTDLVCRIMDYLCYIG
jgi:hypothetical protein